MKALLPFILFLITGSVVAEEAKPAPATLGDEVKGWFLGLERAQQKAAADKKDLLLYFTGSDWCPPCMDLHEQVLSKPEFYNEAIKSFILVELDFPRTLDGQSMALQKANEEAGKHYAVASYPTIILADAQARIYARTGWRPEDREPAKFLAHLREFQKIRADRDAALAAFATAQGQEKAAALAKALGDLKPRDVLQFFKPDYEQAIAADPASEALRPVAFHLKKEALEAELNKLGEKQEWKAILARLDAFIAAEKLSQTEKQEMLVFKLGSHYQLGEYETIFALIGQITALGAETPLAKQALQFKGVIEEEIKAKKEKAAAEAGGTQPQNSPAPK